MLIYIALGLLIFVIYQSGVFSAALRMFGFGEKGMGEGLLNRIDEQIAKMKAIMDLPMTEAHRRTHFTAVHTNFELLTELTRAFTQIFYEKTEAPGVNLVFGNDYGAIALADTMGIFQDSVDFLSVVLNDSYSDASSRVGKLYVEYTKLYYSEPKLLYKAVGIGDKRARKRAEYENNENIDDPRTRVAAKRLIRYAHLSTEHAYNVHQAVVGKKMSRTG